MNDSDLRQLVIEAIDSVDARTGDLEMVKRRGRFRRRTTRTVSATLGAVLVAGILGVFLLQPRTTAIAADSYPAGSQEEFAACLIGQGFQVTVLDDESMLIEYTNDEYKTVERATGFCSDLVSGRSTASEAEVRAEYEHQLAERDCLVEAGYALAEPPTWETFSAQYGDGDTNNDWLAVEDVLGDVSHDDVDVALVACGFENHVTGTTDANK